MNFGQAIQALKNDHRVERKGWNGKGMFLRLHIPSEPDRHPFIEMWTAQKYWIPWLASQADMLAEDWVKIY